MIRYVVIGYSIIVTALIIIKVTRYRTFEELFIKYNDICSHNSARNSSHTTVFRIYSSHWFIAVLLYSSSFGSLVLRPR